MHKAKLTISNPTFGDGSKKVCITVKDVDAGIEFLEIAIDYESFTECLMGLSMVECDMNVRGLEKVGKKIECKQLTFEMPKSTYSNMKGIAVELAKKNAPKGWTASEYFGSKDSFFNVDGKDYAATTMSRWVEKGYK